LLTTGKYDFSDNLIQFLFLKISFRPCFHPIGFVIDKSQGLSPIQRNLQKLESQAIATLETFLNHGIVLIISNGDMSWLNLALNELYPSFKNFLHQQQIPLISARERGSDILPDNSLGWKALTICEQVTRAQQNDFCFPYLLSIGDGQDERLASQLIGEQLDIPCKTIKFLEAPTIAQLSTQLEYVRTYVDWVIGESCQDVQISWNKHDLSVVFEEYSDKFLQPAGSPTAPTDPPSSSSPHHEIISSTSYLSSFAQTKAMMDTKSMLQQEFSQYFYHDQSSQEDENSFQEEEEEVVEEEISFSTRKQDEMIMREEEEGEELITLSTL